jgi:IS1 family transposase
MYMNKLSNEKRSQIIRGLVEGNSISSLVRMTGIAKSTILRLILGFGAVCEAMHDERVKDLSTVRVQMDEVWAFVGAKDKNASDEKKLQGWGDAWTWTAIDADSKLILSWFIGPRDANSSWEIMKDVKSRLSDRVQLTTDGLNAYWNAAGHVFRGEVDFAQLVKIYGAVLGEGTAGKYSPPQCIGIEIKVREGDPDPKHISTSFVERHNLTLRMGMRRYTRLTNGHSKKFENHLAMTSIFMTCYNFCRVHQTLRVTPAMEAGLTDHVWEVEEILCLMD